MTKEAFYDMLSDMDDTLIAEARETKKPFAHKWAALAACLSLLLCGVLLLSSLHTTPTGDTGSADGTSMSNIEPLIAAIAVYPAGESLENVVNATLSKLPLSSSNPDKLQAYLPSQLPKDYALQSLSLYETTMKNSAQYRMLRALYSTAPIDATSGNEATMSADTELGSIFVITVCDHKPNTDCPFYSPGAVPTDIADQTDGAAFYIALDDMYVGFFDCIDLTSEEVAAMIKSIA